MQNLLDDLKKLLTADERLVVEGKLMKNKVIELGLSLDKGLLSLLLSKNLRELLAANAHLSMPKQKELLETTFKNWVGNLEQVDDVTLIGVRVSNNL